ncbi:hypothetical protein BIY37_07140 [Candidatus Brocadia sapporoensis]|uniref:Uncharacterized protein n=1 Tax=Candidatus Brocadia sapporoensis TaxID=392547 RepID=A0A1V6LZX2_9BACT|nr:hypothetical protein [Candidatus Brocadia sapporoensis]MDG6004517.1 hypothetical protein [Candidatus Brocadia sp.]OQD45688.1 hypothetical protein BIY37_07140 [Candidatus Brocadia sapporoensis]
MEGNGKSAIDLRKLLLNIGDRSSIFMEYNKTEYGFQHLSFQEYLTTEQMGNKQLVEALLANYENRCGRRLSTCAWG